MAGRSAAERQELAAVRQAVMAVFEGQGFETIVPDILQPADVFLDRSGENIRSRTFVFTDPSGAELCLRPDLTVPTCRFHLTRRAIAIADRHSAFSRAAPIGFIRVSSTRRGWNGSAPAMPSLPKPRSWQ